MMVFKLEWHQGTLRKVGEFDRLAISIDEKEELWQLVSLGPEQPINSNAF